MLNNREPRFGTGRRAVEHRLDDPTRETARRDRLVSAWMPVAWWNDFGGVTLGVRQRSNYLGRSDRGLVFGSVGTRAGATDRLGVRGGVVYWNPGPGVVAANRYDVDAFERFTGEASVRAPFWLGTTLGLRLFGGAYAGASDPVRQRRIPVAGADPYATFTDPF